MINFILSLFQSRTFGSTRSSKWSSVRKEHLEKHPTCAVCGKKGRLLMPNSVHHCVPFHIDQSKELIPENLITLCPDHHLLVGHLMNFKSYNINVKTDASIWIKKIKSRP